MDIEANGIAPKAEWEKEREMGRLPEAA